MTQGRDHEGRFEPGVSGNPGGRPKLDPETRRIRAITREQYKEVATLILTGTREDLIKLIDNKETSFLQEWIARVALVAADCGDYGPLESILNRLIGKVTDAIEVDYSHQVPKKQLNADELVKLVRLARIDEAGSNP